MITELEDLHKRVDKIEKQRNQEVLTLVEILSNAAFFGGIKKARCENAKNGQCGFFILKNEAKDKIPIAADCRVKQCKESSLHCHIELSDITCALCAITSSHSMDSSQYETKETKNTVKTWKDSQKVHLLR